MKDSPLYHRILHRRLEENQTAYAEVHLPEDSLWFDGHFPEEPLLPGVAQLVVATEVLEKTLGRKLAVGGFRRVRFRQAVRPGESIHVEVTPVRPDGLTYGFRIYKSKELSCSGVLHIAEPSREEGACRADGINWSSIAPNRNRKGRLKQDGNGSG
ncbi:MAG: hypothetical protein ACOWWM_06610 [Desulfobacterales bacterium]